MPSNDGGGSYEKEKGEYKKDRGTSIWHSLFRYVFKVEKGSESILGSHNMW